MPDNQKLTLKLLKERLEAARRRQEYKKDRRDPEYNDSWGGMIRDSGGGYSLLPGLNENMSGLEMRDRISRAASYKLKGGCGVFIAAVGLFSVGILTIATAGDYIYNEETGYHDIENDGSAERGLGVSLIGMAVIFAIIASRMEKHSQRKLDESIDLMLEMRAKFPDVPADMDINKIKRLMDVLPAIVESLSESDRRVLDGLLQDGQSILDDAKRREVAASIMTEHLKQHPKDLELLINAYRGIATWEFAQSVYRNPEQGR